MAPPAQQHYATYHDIIFACTICQATLDQIYEHPESTKGLRDGRSPVDRPVCKLWLTECGHLTCGKHLEGGGAPFHPEGKVPKAPCPRCAKKGNNTPQGLYAIRGIGRGEHDASIPKECFNIPPVTFDDSSPGMDALRFQYLSLLHFGTESHYKVVALQNFLKDEINRNERVSKALEKADDKIAKLKEENERLRGCETELHKYKDKEPEVIKYLQGYTKLMHENAEFREELKELGYAIPLAKYSHGGEDDEQPLRPLEGAEELEHDLAGMDDVRAATDYQRPFPRAGNIHTSNGHLNESSSIRGKSAFDRAISRNGAFDFSETLNGKRRRTESSYNLEKDLHDQELEVRIDSREEMPPPAMPLSRILEEPSRMSLLSRMSLMSNSGLIDRNSLQRPRSPEVKLLEEGRCHGLESSHRLHEERPTYGNNEGSTRNGTIDSNIQVPHSPLLRHAQKESQLGESSMTGVNAPFKSPLQRQERPPSSFQHTDSSLGPLARYTQHARNNARDTAWIPEPRSRHEQYHPMQQSWWTSQRAFPDDRHSFSENRATTSQQYIPPKNAQPNRIDHNTSHNAPRRDYRIVTSALDPRTPAPKRTSNINLADSVTSPFFKSKRGVGSVPTTSRLAQEPSGFRQPQEDVAQGYRMAPAQTRHVEPRSLNGLSFIETPQDSRNAPIFEERQQISDPRLAQRSSIHAAPRETQGFFTRHDGRRSSYAPCDVIPPPSRQTFSRQAAPLPSAMTSAVPSRSASRSSNRLPRDDAQVFNRAQFGGGASFISGRRVLTHQHSAASLTAPQSRGGLFSSHVGMRTVRR